MPDTSPIDMNRVRKFLSDKEKRRNQSLMDRLQKAQSDFQRIVDHIVHSFNPLRIYQWGSLIETEHFSEISDIDIALEGIRDPEEYFNILGDAMKMTDFRLDIVEMEKIGKENAEHIRKKGKLIYERRQNS